MSMNWTQYLLGKLAEEATEVAKEALKCQQQGVNSPYKGKPAIMELRNEFLEVVAVLDMLEERKDVSLALGAHHLVPVTGHDVCQDDDHYAITTNKIYRLCYYAMFAYQSGNLDLTQHEFDQVRQNARCYIQITGKPSIDGIAFRMTGLGGYHRDTLVENTFDPLGLTKAQVSVGSDVRNEAPPAPGLPDEPVHQTRKL
jgi:hypothetical protein